MTIREDLVNQLKDARAALKIAKDDRSSWGVDYARTRIDSLKKKIAAIDNKP